MSNNKKQRLTFAFTLIISLTRLFKSSFHQVNAKDRRIAKTNEGGEVYFHLIGMKESIRNNRGGVGVNGLTTASFLHEH